MSQANGNPQPLPPEPAKPLPTDLAEARQQAKLLRAHNEIRRAQHESKLLENISPWLYNFDTDDLFARLKSPDGSNWTPIAQPQDRRAGAKWPMWRTDTELNNLRQVSRVLCDSNDYAKGLLRNRTNYVIGKGFTYKAGSKEKSQKDELAGLIAGVQDVIDRFCASNRWNTAADPLSEKTTLGPTREQEAYRRTQRDGEALIRFHRQLDGSMVVRFPEPECLRNPPGGSSQNGWSFGIRHRIEPYEDFEDSEEYHFVYQDPSLQNEQETEEPTGETVDAADIVHIKRPEEDAATKRGTPAFAFDTAEALIRASKLQRNTSMSAAVRAARAETWQHDYGTAAQITSLTQGMPTAYQVNDPITQRAMTYERGVPGYTARIPQGQKPVPPPASTGVAEHMDAKTGDLRQACAAASAPEYFAGSTNDANYATASEAGTPFVRAAETEQEHYKAAYLACVWKAVRWAVECDKLPAEALTLIVIQVEAPLVHKNNELQLSQVRASDIDRKLLSPQTAMMELGRDPEIEMANWEEWQERMGQQMAPLPLPGEDGSPPEEKPAAGTPVPAGSPVRESRLREEKDETGHEHKGKGEGGGQFTSGSGGGGTADSGDSKKKQDAQQPASFATPADAEDHFSAKYKSNLKQGKLSDKEFTKAAEHLGDEYERLAEFKAIKSTVKKRALKQKLELGRAFEDNSAGKYRYGEGIELAKLPQDDNATPAFGGHTVGSDLGSAFRHELGHEVYNVFFSGAKQRDWNAKFEKYVGTNTVSRYGGTNTSELFSESFSAYTSKNYKRGSLPADIEGWLDKNVKG